MEKLRLNFILVLLLIITNWSLKAQVKNDREIIENVYELLQNGNSGEVALLTPKINWKETRTSGMVNERYTITFPAIMKNRWGDLFFQELEVTEVAENNIQVTGRVSGRELTECGIIISNFKHSWKLKNGEIIGFSE